MAAVPEAGVTNRLVVHMEDKSSPELPPSVKTCSHHPFLLQSLRLSLYVIEDTGFFTANWTLQTQQKHEIMEGFPTDYEYFNGYLVVLAPWLSWFLG